MFVAGNFCVDDILLVVELNRTGHTIMIKYKSILSYFTGSETTENFNYT